MANRDKDAESSTLTLPLVLPVTIIRILSSSLVLPHTRSVDKDSNAEVTSSSVRLISPRPKMGVSSGFALPYSLQSGWFWFGRNPGEYAFQSEVVTVVQPFR